MLRILNYPESFSKGLEDRFNRKMSRGLHDCGIPNSVRCMWPDIFARRMFFSGSPVQYRLFTRVVAPLWLRMHLLTFRKSDVVCLTSPSLPGDTRCAFEKRLRKRGADLLLWMEDDWFSDPNMREVAEARAGIADAFVGVTPALVDRIRSLCPGRKVMLMEEPIDVERLEPRAARDPDPQPVVVWIGRPWNLNKLASMNPILAAIHGEIPFRLRIITDVQRPSIELAVPWDWLPWERDREAELAAGAVVGLAPLDPTLYDECKGNYKVKTYMALGIAPVTPAIGYNRYLVRSGVNGYLVHSENEWASALRCLLRDKKRAARMGAAAREEIIRRFSYDALMPVWSRALEDAFPGRFGRGHAGTIRQPGPAGSPAARTMPRVETTHG